MAPCSNFSSDVLYEILSRAELKTMRKCRILSRECNSLTYESSFMRLHCQRTKTIAGFFFQSLRSSRFYSNFYSVDYNPGLDPELSLDFLPEPRSARILTTVDQGLMFCQSQYPDDRHYICKPSTRQWEIMPGPNRRYFTAKIAMIVLRSNPLRFKIVRISYGVRDDRELDFEYSEEELDELYTNKRFQCEVFDSNSWVWKQLDDLTLPCREYFNNEPAISACGGLHWLTSNAKRNSILSFYEDKESWELDSLPDLLFNEQNWHSINLAVYKGSLALICARKDYNFVEFWVVSDYYQQKVWIKTHTVNLTSFREKIGHYSVDSFYNADTLLIIASWTAIFYNFKNGRFNQVKLPSVHRQPETYFIHTDYELIQLRQRRKSSIEYSYWFFNILVFICVLIYYILDV